MRSALHKLVSQEDINFLLTNRLPRRLSTRFMGWFSKIENPVVRKTSIAAWKLFSDLDLTEAADTKFRSMHDVFTRSLKPGARPIDPHPDIMTSPCDAIVGASGRIEGDRLYQVKGFPYTLADLLGQDAQCGTFRNGTFVTLRLTSSMYHRFHAPHDCRVSAVRYISGDTWNVNPIALKRIERLFCKNERAVITTELSRTGHAVTLVPVAAILVASIRLGFLDSGLDLRAGGPRRIRCDVPLSKGEEMGWFQHGSTIVLFAPSGFALCDDVREGGTIRAGQALMRLP